MGTPLGEGRFCHDLISVVREPLPQTDSSIEPHVSDIQESVIWIAERAIRHCPEPGFGPNPSFRKSRLSGTIWESVAAEVESLLCS